MSYDPNNRVRDIVDRLVTAGQEHSEELSDWLMNTHTSAPGMRRSTKFDRFVQIASAIDAAFIPGQHLPKAERHHVVEYRLYADDNMPLVWSVGPHTGSIYAYFRTEHEARSWFERVKSVVGKYVEEVKRYKDENPKGGGGLRLQSEASDRDHFGQKHPGSSRDLGRALGVDVGPEPAALREKAAGILGAKLNTLEREGWRVVEAPAGAKASHMDILGPLNKSKVDQLLESGITLINDPGRSVASGVTVPDDEGADIVIERFHDGRVPYTQRFKKGDSVAVFFSKDRFETGELVGVSRAKQEARVRFTRDDGSPYDQWFAFGSIYPEDYPNAQAPDDGRKFLARKYGLTTDEAAKLAARPDVVEKVEKWRNEHGGHAASSLARGKIAELLSAEPTALFRARVPADSMAGAWTGPWRTTYEHAEGDLKDRKEETGTWGSGAGYVERRGAVEPAAVSWHDSGRAFVAEERAKRHAKYAKQKRRGHKSASDAEIDELLTAMNETLSVKPTRESEERFKAWKLRYLDLTREAPKRTSTKKEPASNLFKLRVGDVGEGVLHAMRESYDAGKELDSSRPEDIEHQQYLDVTLEWLSAAKSYGAPLDERADIARRMLIEEANNWDEEVERAAPRGSAKYDPEKLQMDRRWRDAATGLADQIAKALKKAGH